MSRAFDLFSKIKQGGFHVIEQMIEDKIPEELFLDYKNVATAHPSNGLAPDDRKNFAKAISGFGNSDGGLVIWGVDCRREKSRGDVPSELKIIPNALWFKTLLDGQVSGVTLPPHSGVENFSLSKLGEDEGVVVSYIPETLSVPLKGVPDGAKDYYIRAGSSFLPTPHGVLAGMFGKRPQPQLDAALRYLDVKINPDSKETIIRLGLVITNVGRGVATDIHYEVAAYSSANLNFRETGSHAPAEWSFRKRPSDRYWLNAASNEKFQRQAPGEELHAMEFSLSFRGDRAEDFELSGYCGTSNSPGKSFRFQLSRHQLGDIAKEMNSFQDNPQLRDHIRKTVRHIIEGGII